MQALFSPRGARRMRVAAALVVLCGGAATLATATVAAPLHSTGISGFSSKAGVICTFCHSGGVAPTVKLVGPAFVLHDSTVRYTFTVSGGQMVAAGLDAAIDQTEHGCCEYVGGEELQFAIGVQPKRPAIEDIVDGIFLQPRANEPPHAKNEESPGGVPDALFREQFVKSVARLFAHINGLVFARRFWIGTIGIDIAARKVHVEVAVEVDQAAAHGLDELDHSGRQYVAVPVGWGGWAEGFLPGMLGAGHGSALIVFALPESS
jgi:hypothetical protein